MPRRRACPVSICRSSATAAAVATCCTPACCCIFAVGGFVGTSLALAVDAWSGFRLPLLPTALALAGVLCLLAASFYLGLEVTLAVRTFDEELDLEGVGRES